MTVKNAQGKGTVYYGMHFYPGIASYAEGDGELRVFLNENNIRKMDPSFAGRPVFVHHVDGVEDNVDDLRKEADGWVVESFYNAADGKHWAKFIIVTERAEKAISRGMRLSNCYIPKSYGPKGTWNGFSYDKEITSAEYEHLAIVPNPRYEESVIMSPEQFKAYNSEKELELKRLANSKNEGDKKMSKFKWFKREKVENSIDLEAMSVELPTSKREVTISSLINEADALEKTKGIANSKDTVEVDGVQLTVEDLIESYKNAKKNKEDDEDKDDDKKDNDDMDDEGDADSMDNEDDDEEERKAALKKAADDKKENAKKKAAKLKNAADKHVREQQEEIERERKKIANKRDMPGDKLKRGKARYGSK